MSDKPKQIIPNKERGGPPNKRPPAPPRPIQAPKLPTSK